MTTPKAIGYIFAEKDTNEVTFVNKNGQASTYVLKAFFKGALAEPAYFVGFSNQDLIIIYGDENKPDCLTTNQFIHNANFLKQLFHLLGFNGENLNHAPNSRFYNS